MPSNKKQLEWKRDGDCMIVTSHRANQDGYIRMCRGGKYFYIHRLVCERRHGPLGALESLHSCDNRACINPDHISPGTHGENMVQATTRGRMAQGERHTSAKLTAETAMAVFNASGTLEEIAKKFGVNWCTVRAVKRKHAWKSIH